MEMREYFKDFFKGPLAEAETVILDDNAIRPMAIGRKNYLFCGSHGAAQNAAMLYSFFGSCKMQNINPREWLEDTLQRIPDHSIQKLEELLPGYQTTV